MVSNRLIIGLILVVATAGCAGALGGDAPIDQTPDTSELVVHVDMDSFQDDPETNRLSELLDENDPGAQSIDEVESELEEELDVDLDDIDTVLMFVEDVEASEQFGESNFGLITHGEFDTQGAIDTIQEEEDLTETSYKDQTVYTTEDSSMRGDTIAFAILDDGQLVFGDQQSVESAIDTSLGDEDALSGDLRAEYDQATDGGLVAVVAEVPEDIIPSQGGPGGIDISVFESVSIVSFEYYTPDGTVGLNARFLTDSSSDAEDIQSVLDAALVTFGDTGSPEADAEIDNIQTEQDGNVVVANYEGDLDDIEAVINSIS